MSNTTGLFQKLWEKTANELLEIQEGSPLEEQDFNRLVTIWLGEDFLGCYRQWLNQVNEED